MMDLAVIESEASGLMPSGWSERKLQDVAHLINGRGFKPFEWDTAGLPIIRIQNLNGSNDFNYYSGRYDPKIEVDPGQLLFAWSGSRGTSFGPHIWNGPKGVLNYHTWKVRVNASEIVPGFFFHVLRHLTRIIEEQAHGASALVHVQKWEMEKFPFQCPDDPKEQQAIAEALSDADALIEGLEGLIAKKRLIKQGAMQDLLTAKRRLPGFSGDWTVHKLAERGTFFKGSGVRKDEANSGELPCVRYGELYTLHHDVVRSFASFLSLDVAKTARQIRTGDILFAGSGETKEEIGKNAVVTYDGEMYAGGDIIGLRPNIDDPVFLSYMLNAPNAQQQKSRKGQGDAVVHIGATALGEIKLALPPFEEQRAISTVLEDMDAEIQALETRLDKARQVKEGMMQNLLTGRIRLV